MGDYVVDSVEHETSDEVPIETGVGLVTQPSADRPCIIRLELGNPTEREVHVSTGFPFPLGDDGAVESPVPAYLRPTEDHVRRHHLTDPRRSIHDEPPDDESESWEPFHRGALDRDGSKCWIAEPFGGMDVLVGKGIRPGQTLSFDFGLVVHSDAEACFPPGAYVFETDLLFSRHPDADHGQPVNWRITVEIT